MVPYAYRIIETELKALMKELPAISIDGAKGVGKTMTACRFAQTVYELDDLNTIAALTADPKRIIQGSKPILVDEWQRFPSTFDIIRRAVDKKSAPGQFLLTGSAGPNEAPTHSGAGRIVRIRMRPMSLVERQLDVPTVSLRSLLTGNKTELSGHTKMSLNDYVREICASGFPAIRGLTGRARRAMFDGYVDRIIDRDFKELGHPVKVPFTLKRWLTAYAAASSSTTSLEKIRGASTPGEDEKPAKSTVQSYREILEKLWIIDSIPGWLPSKNQFSRLGVAPKHHLVDPALAAHLLGASEDSLLQISSSSSRQLAIVDVNLLGGLFESLVTQSIRVYAQTNEAVPSHFRSHSGEREIDLIVERNDKKVVAIEVKLTQNPSEADVKHLLWLREQLKSDLLDAVVVTTGTSAYRRKDGIAVVPASLLGP